MKKRSKTKDEIHKNMSAIKCSGSKIEVLMGKALWCLGLRYRKNYKKVMGKPDFAFPSVKVAVFCDSSFWHGRNWGSKRKSEFRTNKTFWVNKIEKNIARDKTVNKELKKIGWKVFRFWEDKIILNAENCAKKVFIEIEKKRLKP
jgi:DNA mismatch endonuclease (patch repair protein)